MKFEKYMLFAGWEVRNVKNAARGRRTDPKPVNNLFIFSKLSNEKRLTEKNSRKRYCDRGQG